jgi:hypothetical protein
MMANDGNDLEESSSDLNEAQTTNFPGLNEENHEKSHPGYL